jgi:hypothetical protein
LTPSALCDGCRGIAPEGFASRAERGRERSAFGPNRSEGFAGRKQRTSDHFPLVQLWTIPQILLMNRSAVSFFILFSFFNALH